MVQSPRLYRGGLQLPAVPAVCFLMFLVEMSSAKPKKGDNETEKIPMPRHSFKTPLEYTTLLDDWLINGASIAEPSRLLIHPSVPERHGFAFNKLPILTNNFEVIFHFRFEGVKTDSFPIDQSFAFWYVRENITANFDEKKVVSAASWSEGLKEQEYTFGGFKDRFKGFGAVLSLGNAQKKASPVVTFVSGDGMKRLSYGVDVPTPSSKKMEFRNTLNPAMMKIRVQPGLVEAHLKQSPSLSWNECFRQNLSEPLERGYIGFTAWSGSAVAGGGSDLVSIIQLEVSNYDDTAVGEDLKDVSTKIQETYREMLTDQNRHFVDQQSQKEHLERLTSMLNDHIDADVSETLQINHNIGNVENRLTSLVQECTTLSTELKILGNGTPVSHKEHVESTKKEIVGIRQALLKESSKQQKTLGWVNSYLDGVKDKALQGSSPVVLNAIVKQTETLEKTVSARSSQKFWMVLCIFGVVITFGVLMWHRMHYYEKKHFNC